MNNKNNAITLKGRLVAVPKLNTTKAGVPVTSFTIAADRQYKEKGARRKTDFFSIVCWRDDAEYICKHCVKGSVILVDGEMQTKRHPDKNGKMMTWYEVVADRVFVTSERKNDLNEPVIPEVNGISDGSTDETSDGNTSS